MTDDFRHPLDPEHADRDPCECGACEECRQLDAEWAERIEEKCRQERAAQLASDADRDARDAEMEAAREAAVAAGGYPF